MRTASHTVVYDNDPDYGRFEKDETGTIARLLRITLVQQRGSGELPIAYLGSVKTCAVGPSYAEIAPLLGVVLANAVTLMNPSHLILGGGVLSRAPVLKEHVITACEGFRMVQSSRKGPITSMSFR